MPSVAATTLTLVFPSRIRSRTRSNRTFDGGPSGDRAPLTTRIRPADWEARAGCPPSPQTAGRGSHACRPNRQGTSIEGLAIATTVARKTPCAMYRYALQLGVIVSWRHKGLKRLYIDDDPRKIRPDVVERVRDILALLDVAEKPNDMDACGMGLHPLRGDLRGFWSVTVTRNHRIIFRFSDRNVYDVNMIDYH